MLKKLQQVPFFLFLLPAFFVLHGLVENYTFISISDSLLLLGIYCGATGAIFLCFQWIVKDKIKASLIASFIMAFYLFFGAFHDFLRKHSIFLHKYSIILPAFILSTILLTFYFKKKKSFPRLPLFLNVLFLAYIIIDGLILAGKATGHNCSPLPSYSFSANNYQACDSCKKPDIYFFIFDGYSGSKTLKEIYGYDNSSLDSFLVKEDFHIQKGSRSNYCITPFSIASILNFSYLNEVPDPQGLRADDYTNVFEPIRKNEVVNFLVRQGYAILNNSFFDLPGHPSDRDQPFIPVKTKLITNRTLFSYMKRDMEWWFNEHIKDSAINANTEQSAVYRNNTLFLSRTLEESSQASARPRFIYTHVLMPHYPFLFDSVMHRRSAGLVASQMDETRVKPYLDYLPYTNSCIKSILSAVRKNSAGKAVIIFMSDHGFRHSDDGTDHSYDFNNQNAVYFPDRDYRMLYDSISGVNMFRVVFNKLFRQNLPILKDSLIFLRDNK
ncbi:sulfatase-like hydrolase/transferase [Flavitalea flava]